MLIVLCFIIFLAGITFGITFLAFIFNYYESQLELSKNNHV